MALCLVRVCHSHEDGSVRFWDVSGSCLRLSYKLDTASLFGIDTLPHAGSSTADLSDDWPPFRKVPYYSTTQYELIASSVIFVAIYR